MKTIHLSVAALLLAASFGTAAAGDAAAGKAKFGVCSACHGPTGAGNPPTYPKLKGRDAAFITAQLQAFKSGARQNPTMQGMVAGLSEADMENLGAYVATLK